MKSAALHFLTHLQRLQPAVFFQHSAALTACLASFTHPKDPWTNEEGFALAGRLLSSHLALIKSVSKDFDLLITDLLLDHVKPLFIKSNSSLLTPQARKAISPRPGPAAPSDFEDSSKPWKFNSPHIVTVFQWVLSQLDPPRIEKHWPLLIPPLLTILDDVSITYKIRGCTLLNILLGSTPSTLLERSGLGGIFHDTLLPYTLFLPTLTPEADSVPLLNATYTTLIILTNTRFPPSTSSSSPSRIKTLSTIFRYGILKGYTHAGENPRISELLMHKSTDLVNAMGIYSVKHLKDLLPIISTILTAPFATAYPPLLQAAVECLKAVIVNGWPRVKLHRGEILEGLVVCWCKIVDEGVGEHRDGLLEVKGGIREVLRAVVQILRGDEEAMEEFKMLSDCDEQLKDCFQSLGPKTLP